MADHLVEKRAHKYDVRLSTCDNQQVVIDRKIDLFASDTADVQF